MIVHKTQSMLDSMYKHKRGLYVYLHFDLVCGRFNALDIEWHLYGNLH